MSKPRKRKGSPYYWYDFTVAGIRYRGSTQTDCPETAKSIIAKLRLDAVKGEHFQPEKAKINFEVACCRFLEEHAMHLKSYKTIDGHITRFLKFFGNICLSQIGNKEVHSFVAHCRSLVDDAGNRLLTDSTINRHLETLRKMLFLARDKWEVVTGCDSLRSHMLREPEARTRWITKIEANKLIECASPHLKAPIKFALLTGVRLSNITGLQWKSVNFIHREITFRIKSNIPDGKTLVLPITDDLGEVLKSLYNNTKKPDDYVFVYRGRRIKDSFKKSFKTACKNAGLHDFRFHDLRHTAASWMVQSGIPIDLVQEILGHTQISTTKKYAHRDQSERMNAMRLLTLEAQTGHNTYPHKRLSA